MHCSSRAFCRIVSPSCRIAPLWASYMCLDATPLPPPRAISWFEFVAKQSTTRREKAADEGIIAELVLRHRRIDFFRSSFAGGVYPSHSMPEIYDDSGAENNVRCVEIAHCTLTLTSYLQLGGRVNWPLPSQKNTREENHTRTRQSHVLELLTVGRSWRKKAMCVRSACVTLALYFPARCFLQGRCFIVAAGACQNLHEA